MPARCSGGTAVAEIRTFVAIHVAEAITSRLVALQQALRQAGASVAWTRPEGMHLTVKFLGNIAEERLPAIITAIDAAARQCVPFTVEVTGTGVFPTPRAPRVLWAGVRVGTAPLSAIAALVDTTLASIGFPSETRPFRPHLTLGRIKSPEQVPQLMTLLACHAEDAFGSMPVTEMRVMRSDLSPQGARYTVLHRAAFTGDEPAGE